MIRLRKVASAALLPAAILIHSPAAAQMAESGIRQPTDLASPHLFQSNPASPRPAGNRAGLLLLRDNREVSLDQTASAGDRLHTKAADEYALLGGEMDLGAGASIGLFHQLMFGRSESKSSASERNPKVELQKVQHSAVKLNVELTSELRAGLAIRYMAKETTIFGEYFLGEGRQTRYRATMFGYGGGFAYTTSRYGGSYSYFPPLRGKAEISGEERIIVEPGETSLDAYFAPTPPLVVGILYKRSLNELDDRATGTTANDDSTNISLYGLDLDQYVRPFASYALGASYAFSRELSLRGSLALEKAEYAFIDLQRINRLDVRQPEARRHEEISTQRLRAALRFVGGRGVDAQIGLGLFSRGATLPQDMNGARYEASGREVFATVSLQL